MSGAKSDRLVRLEPRPRLLAFEPGANGQSDVAYVHRTEPPKPRSPYVPVALAELDDLSVAGDALVLLMRLRRVADREETDGILTPRSVESVRVLYGYSRLRFTKLVQNLQAAARIYVGSDAIYDTKFIDVCRNSDERKRRREQWNRAQQT